MSELETSVLVVGGTDAAELKEMLLSDPFNSVIPGAVSTGVATVDLGSTCVDLCVALCARTLSDRRKAGAGMPPLTLTFAKFVTPSGVVIQIRLRSP